MSKIVCECGCVISDQTDRIRHKARFVADQDFFDFLDTIEKEKGSARRYLGDIFQCPDCGNIMIYSADYNRRCDFKSINKEQCKDVTQSCFGEQWKGSLTGHYYGAAYSLEYKRNKGELYWDTNKESSYIRDMTLEELRTQYYKKFEELKALDILRGSFLRVDGVDEHTFG